MNNITNQIYSLEKETLENFKLSKSNNTLRNYKSDFEDFKKFCSKFNFNPLPANPKFVTLYLTNLSKQNKFSTIKRRLASLSAIHKLKGFYLDIKNPLIVENLNGIKRAIGIKQIPKKPLLINNLVKIINYIDEQIVNNKILYRDKVILLLAFSGGFRRSEIVNLNFEDLEFVQEGLIINLKKSKNDQYGEGMRKAIPYFLTRKYCPVYNLTEFLKLNKIDSGPIFRRFRKGKIMTDKRLTDQSLALIIKYYLSKIGLEESHYSGHSLRSGFATSAASSGADERSIMSMTGHKTVQMVRRYIKDGELFKNNPLNKIKL